jgi:predicted solute-binding protein
MAKTADKQNKEHLNELKEMVQNKSANEPVEKVLTIFCHRHGVSMTKCREYYDDLVAKGEIQEK